MAGGADRLQRTGRTPLWSARAGLLDPVARNRIKFIEIAIHFRQNASNIPTRQTAPSFLNDRYPAENLWSRSPTAGPESPALANSGVAVHRLQDQATAGRGMCWMPLRVRAMRRKRCRPVKAEDLARCRDPGHHGPGGQWEEPQLANEEHVALLKQGMKAWNAWRKKNPNVVPDLSGVNRVNPRRADLPDAEISGVRFIGT